jgi:putative ABC transport system permease protein|nr:ABC transporter permease [Candidatus Acidoferrales bacterium]
MGSLWQDIKFGLRTLAKSPGFTAIAIVALALGIGANTAIFSIADAFLLKPVNIPDPEHLVIVAELAPGKTSDPNSVTGANFVDWKAQAKSFEPLGAYQWDDVNLTSSGALPEKVQGFKVTSNIFELCGEEPLYGRTFLPEEDQPGHDGVVVLGERLWERRFGGDHHIIGQEIHIDGRPYTVIGIMRKGFDFPQTAELWIPIAFAPQELQDRKSHFIWPVGKLKPGVTLSSANAEMKTLARRLSDTYPETNHNWSANVVPVRIFELGHDTIQYTVMLLGAVGFLLLIVCANVANLQLVRGASRHKEMAIRVALGGSRWRLVRQLLTESVLVGIGGAVLGLVLAKWAVSLVVVHMPPEVAKFIPGWNEIRLDSRAMLFTMIAGVVAGIISGLLPAFQGARLDVNETLKEGGRSSSSSRGRHVLRNGLVVTQVALATILVVGSALLVRGFNTLLNFNHGFQPETLLTMYLDLPDTRYAKPEQRNQFYSQVLERMGAMPGVLGAAGTSWIPYGDGGGYNQFSIEGKPWHDASETPTIVNMAVSPNYLHMVHVPLIQGRELSESDSADSQLVGLVSQSLAKRYWPAGDAIGHHIRLGGNDSKNPWMTIVGIVGDVKMDWNDTRPLYAIYRTYKQAPRGYFALVVRSSGDPMALARAAGAAVASIDNEMPLTDVLPMTKVIGNSIIGITYVAVMMGVIGVMALILAAVGVYGVMAFTVQERTYEIGVRMAFGAQTSDVLRMIIGRGLLLAGIGLGIGLPVTLGITYALRDWIFGIGAADPTTFTAIAVALLSAALLACWIPARRATRVDPMIALRYE